MSFTLLKILHHSINSIARNNFNKSGERFHSLKVLRVFWLVERKKIIIKVIIKNHLKLGQPKSRVYLVSWDKSGHEKKFPDFWPINVGRGIMQCRNKKCVLPEQINSWTRGLNYTVEARNYFLKSTCIKNNRSTLHNNNKSFFYQLHNFFSFWVPENWITFRIYSTMSKDKTPSPYHLSLSRFHNASVEVKWK